MRFAKYHALGNDYLVLEQGAWAGTDGGAPPPAALVRAVCDRHRGVGADGVLVAGVDPGGRPAMRVFNPDGSEAETSGNGLRIFARWLWDRGRVGGEAFDVATRGGVKRCRVRDAGRTVFVEMGRASFDSAAIPVAGPRREVVDEAIEVLGERLRLTAVTVGNPHCVVFVDAPTAERSERLGPVLETHPAFPRRTNVQLVRVVDRGRIEVEIWERGAGRTLASGSSCTRPMTVALSATKALSETVGEMPSRLWSMVCDPIMIGRSTMRARARAIQAMLLCLGLLAACGRGAEPVPELPPLPMDARILAFGDSLKEGAAAAIAALDARHIRSHLITGDNRGSARVVAEALHIDDVHAEVLPADKAATVAELKKGGAVVAMVGDGINDAPALALASVGVAMGGAGSAQALETADIALMQDDIAKLPYVVRLARFTQRIIRANIALTFIVKALFLALAAAGLTTMWLAIFADVGMSLMVTLNGMRPLRWKQP